MLNHYPMFHLTHAVDYYQFLFDNFYTNAPYFKDYEAEGKIDDVDYPLIDMEEYINYEADCFDHEITNSYREEFIPPINHVIEDLEILRYLVRDLMIKTITPALREMEDRIKTAFLENKPRKIKHELRLLNEMVEETKITLNDMMGMGECEKQEDLHYDLIVDNFIETTKTMKTTYEKTIEDWIEKVHSTYRVTTPIQEYI